MYYKTLQEGLLVNRSAWSAERMVPLKDFAFISALVYSPQDDCLLLTGVHKDDRMPSLKENRRGDLKLYRFRFSEDQWSRLYDGYSHDPVPIPGSGNVAFHYGSGLAVVDQNGTQIVKCNLGTFNWGPPSLSASPDGTRVALVKWKGDDRKLFVFTLGTETGARYRPSLYSYSWYDDDHILYELGSSLKQLNLETGRSTVFLQNLVKLLPAAEGARSEALRELCDCDLKMESTGYRSITIIQDRVYCAFQIGATKHKPYDSVVGGLCSIDKERNGLRIEYLLSGEDRIEHYTVEGDGTIAIQLKSRQGSETGESRRVVLGSPDSPLNDGWHIMRTGLHPEFGFHYLRA